jgi:hypothetical protein
MINREELFDRYKKNEGIAKKNSRNPNQNSCDFKLQEFI